MQAKKRYFYVAAGGVLALFLIAWFSGGDEATSRQKDSVPLVPGSGGDTPSFLGADDFAEDVDLTLSARHRREGRSQTLDHKKCTMESCFDYSLCK